MPPSKNQQDEQETSIQRSNNISLKTLKTAIPPSCFQPSLGISLAYLARDIIYTAALLYLALQIPTTKIGHIRIFAWLLYGFVQGCVWTGLWIIGHECGHGAFVKSTRLNDLIGWIVHSFLLVPFFAWKITHARHHRYAGHMGKDVVYVPPTESQNKAYNENKRFEMLPLIEETPVVTAVQLIGRQLLGWQLYLWFNLTAGNKSAPARPKHRFCPNSSHFDPSSTLFLPSQRPLIMLSNLGLCITIVSLCFLGAHLECTTVALLYFMPYLWVHHWIVAITYLHHTHPSVPHYTEGTWTFTNGALCTIDRSFGVIGRHFFHDIFDYHVIHHLFPRMPFYKAEEATKAVRPILGEHYHDEKSQSFLWSLFDTFRNCDFVCDQSVEDGTCPGVLHWAKKKDQK